MARVSTSRFQVSAGWLAAAALFLGGCGGLGIEASSLGGVLIEEGGANTGGDAGATPKADVDAGRTHDIASPAPDSGGAGESPYLNNPLCKVSKTGGSCNPDAPSCISGAYDGGANACTSQVALCEVDSGTPIIPAACRVEASGPGCVVATGATPTGAYNSNNTQGAPCSQSSDCAIGFECVGDSKQGTCKHYCCDSTTCESASATGYGPRPFCDIETALGGLAVPVCTSEKPCAPLTPGACESGKTCTVVNPATAQTACVKIGTAQVGDECVDTNCTDSLACVNGTCHQLCKGSSSCPSAQKCIQSSAFQSLDGVGICE